MASSKLKAEIVEQNQLSGMSWQVKIAEHFIPFDVCALNKGILSLGKRAHSGLEVFPSDWPY